MKEFAQHRRSDFGSFIIDGNETILGFDQSLEDLTIRNHRAGREQPGLWARSDISFRVVSPMSDHVAVSRSSRC